MTRIGLLGVAHLHIDTYLEHLRAVGAVIVGVTDHDGERGRRWAARNGLEHVDTTDELLRRGVDGVVVCAETNRHADLVTAAAQHGAAVLCEKPLGVTVADSAQVVEACDSAGVPLMTAFPCRFEPTIQRIHQLVTAGTLGTIRSLSGTNQSVMPLRERAWFADPTAAGGGAIMDHVVHLADVYNWLLGSAPTQVYAAANRIVHSDVVTVETSGLVMLTYPEGVIASIDCSWNRPLDYPTWGGMAFSVMGDAGVAETEPMRQRLTRFGGGRPYSWTPWGPDSDRAMIESFVRCAADHDRLAEPTGRDGLLATWIALAALRSVETGAPIELVT